MSRMWGRASAKVLAAAAAMVLVAPIAIVVVISFSGDGSLAFPPRSWSLRWHERFLSDFRWQGALWYSIAIAAGAALIGTATGFLAAYALVRSDMRGKQAILALILTPMIVPHVITAIALYYVSSPLGLVGALPWLSVVHAMLGLPVVVLMIASALAQLDPNLERAAIGMGCGPAQVFRRVVIPLATPGIISAGLFAFLSSFDELIVALFLAGVRTQTLPVRIWNSLGMEVEPTVAAASTALIAATLAVLLLDWAVRSLRSMRATARRAAEAE